MIHVVVVAGASNHLVHDKALLQTLYSLLLQSELKHCIVISEHDATVRDHDVVILSTDVKCYQKTLLRTKEVYRIEVLTDDSSTSGESYPVLPRAFRRSSMTDWQKWKTIWYRMIRYKRDGRISVIHLLD